MEWLQGTGVAVITPFTAENQVDNPALAGILEHLIQGGVAYLVMLGTTAESATLDVGEQLEVLELAFSQVAGRCPIVIGAGGNHTAEVARKMAKFSTAFPATAAYLSVSPYYNKPSQEGIYQHYRALAADSDKPLILYNVPGRTASNLTAETTLRLAQLPGIVATKEASGNLEQAMEIMREAPAGFQVISGDDALTLPLMSLGASGVISVTANALPGPFSEMVRAAAAGDFARARQLHYKLLPLIQLNFAEGNPAGVKGMMAQLGLCEAHTRLPIVPATPALQARMREALAGLD
ncbi:MAG: 4-hydroxy-tetrahydrodipicolinate synthase [Bacteroidetes bacterium]|nr:MAG: 4-hydroxy-tetrahydrodipicolinate synthase [Bacteroidota bacterium]